MADQKVLHEVSAMLETNVLKVRRDGPGLSYGFKQVVLARSLEGKASGLDVPSVLIVGMGGLGVGVVWQKEENAHATLAGYFDALVVS